MPEIKSRHGSAREHGIRFRQTHADHVAYIALHLAGVLDPCRNKLNSLIQNHRQQLRNAEVGARQIVKHTLPEK